MLVQLDPKDYEVAVEKAKADLNDAVATLQSLRTDVPITSITTADLEAAEELGYRIKLLGVAVKTDKGIEQRVHPTMVRKDSAIAQVMDVTNAVTIDAEGIPFRVTLVVAAKTASGDELLDSLESAGAHPKLIWEAGDGDVGTFRKIALTAGGAQEFAVHLEAQGLAVDVSVDHLTTRTKLAGGSDYDLLREELAIPDRDPIFERSLARVARLAQEGQ